MKVYKTTIVLTDNDLAIISLALSNYAFKECIAARHARRDGDESAWQKHRQREDIADALTEQFKPHLVGSDWREVTP